MSKSGWTLDNVPLYQRISLEVLSALVSTCTVAPIISIMDKAVVSNASGLEPMGPALLNGIKLLFSNPVAFVRQPSFLIVWGVYTGIYSVANSVEATCEYVHQEPLYPKFFVTSSISISLNILKDNAFGRLFGVGTPKAMPYISMACFGGRNAMTIFAAFTYPGTVSRMIQKETDLDAKRADWCAQLSIPVTMQIFNNPLHLLGYDIYNKNSASFGERLEFIKREYFKTLLARMCHIFPAYGIGGVLNQHLRTSGKDYLKHIHRIDKPCPSSTITAVE